MAQHAFYETREWLEVIRSVMLRHKADAAALEETLAQYRDQPMTLVLFQRLAVRMSGNLERLRCGQPVPAAPPTGNCAENALARVVRLYDANDDERPGQVDFLPLTGLFAGYVLPGRPWHKAVKLIKLLDPRMRLLTRTNDFLGCELDVLAAKEEGRALVASVPEQRPPRRRRLMKMTQYRYRRGAEMAEHCPESRTCVDCPRGQMASGAVSACEYALRPVSEEDKYATYRQGTVPIVPALVDADSAAG
jgi:hypothetical protein